MSDYPLGGMTRTVNTVDAVDLFDTVYDDAVFLGLVVDTLYPAGTILGRVTASAKLSPSFAAAVDGSEVPVAVLGSAILTANPLVDQDIRVIVGGRVREGKLSFTDAAAITPAVKDVLRGVGIVALSTTELSKLDN